MSDQGNAAEVRTEQLRIRLTAGEKAEIARRAKAVGKNSSEYVRDLALAQLPATNEELEEYFGGGSDSAPTVEGPKEELSTVHVEEGPGGTVRRIPPTPVEQARIEAEVAESRLQDDPARAAFIERRTRELHGQGRTTPVARAEAEAEWRQRGA